jgi:hypothetical protein
MVTGIHKFFYERRDKYRIFSAGLKIAKRRKKDLHRFSKLQYIARSLRVAVYESTVNYQYLEDIFYESVFKFDRTDDDCNLLYTQACPNIIPQIIVPLF